MEDELDWSDGSIGPTSPLPGALFHGLPELPYDFELPDLTYPEDPTADYAEPEKYAMPLGEPFTPYLTEDAQLRPAISRAQRSKIGVHLNRRKPTREDCSTFLMYQASQKVYEATFLKNFLIHALHPNQLSACLPNDDGHRESIHQYLRSVSDNVNKIVQKAVWNTHSRTIHFMANDGKETTPFWDFHQFDSGLFADFVPGNTFLTMEMMNESWHKAFKHPSMVRYTSKQYDIGVHASPFEEIDDVTGNTKLFEDQDTAHAASHDRVVHPPRAKKPKNHNLPGAILREDPSHPRDNWLQGFGAYSGNDSASNPVSSTNSQTVGTTHLESLVAYYGPNILLQDPLMSYVPEDTRKQGVGTKGVLWRTKLIEDHKRRLAQRWPQSQQTREAPLDFETYVDRAITRGDLRPLIPDLVRIFDYVARSEEKATPALALQSKATQNTPYKTRQSLQTEGSSDHDAVPQTERESTQAKRSKSRVPTERPNKRQKTAHKPKQPKPSAVLTPSSSGGLAGITPRSSLSKTLEDHQQLPPDAYFEKTFDDEQPVWLCGIKHCMGYYYNAGDRKNCAGCFTSFNQNPKRKDMDFYLPSRSHFFQPAPGIVWKPSKPRGKTRQCTNMSHNSIAKDVYWTAISSGATTDEAWQKGIEAVQEHLRAKVKVPPKEPTPEPTPEPVDLGPHPSGSKTMEHGQQIPKGAYFEKQQRYDEFAWRCDVNHALGRYYFAGDVKTCHGCGSCLSGGGKNAVMDFYLPPGTIARQEAPDLVNWRPRKPYRLTKTSKKKKQTTSHNQVGSKKYWEFIDEGREPENALKLAIEATDAYIEAKLESARAKLAKSSAEDSDASEHESEGEQVPVRRGRSGAQLLSMVPKSPVLKMGHNEVLNDSERDEVTEYETEQDSEPQAQETIYITSDDESTSDSDSE